MSVFTTIIKQLINGLQSGSIYALVALGYSMVYGIIMLLNFAHGDVIMVGAYIAWMMMARFAAYCGGDRLHGAGRADRKGGV